ncbi:MAG: leucine-rich repeat protein [Lachnospiraceae bacterium]|nr:leucine-rich repeat protein [Lachnospiraceae bacterium]
MSNKYLTADGAFSYEINNDSITILSYEGNEHFLPIPDKMDDLPVTAIVSKAFLGKKNITHLILPDSVTAIGDWAFAHMSGLQVITLPSQDLILGKQIFMDCPSVSEIRISGKSDADPNLAFYMAYVYNALKNTLLFRFEDAGSDAWYQELDDAICRFLDRPDDDGFEPVYLGWFEDEDVMTTQYPPYVQKKRLEKAALSLRRLRFPNALNDSHRLVYEDYLQNHFDRGVWDCFLSEPHWEDCGYLQLILDLSCINANNIDHCIADCNRTNATQAVAMLINYKDTQLVTDDFFDQLNL